MPKHKIIASRPLQILGHEDTVEPGTVLATIETDCEIGSLISSLQFGNATLESEATEAEAANETGDKPTTRRTSKRTTAAAAPAGDGGTKSRLPSRRR